MAALIIAIALLLVIVINFIVSLTRHQRRLANFYTEIPGPSGLPIIGNVLQFVKNPEELWNHFRFLGNKYYPIYKIWGLCEEMVNIRHPDDAEVLLSSSKNLTKSRVYHFFHDWFGTGLLTSTDEKWQKRRKILTPTFHFNILREFADILDEEGHRMVAELKSKNCSITVDLVSFITKYTLNAICETAMCTSPEKVENSLDFQQIYRKSVHDLGNLIIRRIARPWIHPDFIFFLTSMGRLHKKCLKVIHDFTKKIIDERQKYHEDTRGIYLQAFNENNSNIEQTNYQSSKKKLAMLDVLIAAMKNGHIDDDGIQEEVDTFMFEGHDTTAMGVIYTLLLIAEHSDIQQRIRDEIDEVLKNCEGRMTITELQRLPYLERCIKEALRLYPSVPIVSRVITHDMQMNKYKIPAGTMATIHIYDLHRDPDFWPNPLQYDPDRFLPEQIQERHPFSYVPFSGGPRNCIGQKFAMMELKAMIGHLIHNFYLKPIDLANNVRITLDLVLRPVSPTRIEFIPR